MKKTRIILSATILILLTFCVLPCYAASDTEIQCADALYELGLFTGTGIDEDGLPIYNLDNVPTRVEAVTMLVRLLGKEDEAKSGDWETPFTDVADWAEPYVGYAYNNGLAKGTGPKTFGGEQYTDAKQYLTFVLRALGYSDSEGDFLWSESYKLANTLGICSGEYDEDTNFLRGNIVTISYKALKTKMKGINETLIEYLYNSKSVNSLKIADVSPEARKLEFDSILSEFSENHQALLDNSDYSGYNKYIKNISSDNYALTSEEAKLLVKYKDLSSDSLSKEDAVYDTELLFKAFQSAYGAYYYYGAENFASAKERVLSWINEQTVITAEDLGEEMHQATLFMQDGHAYIYKRQDKYKYYYIKGLYFRKDDNGYYLIKDGSKWYYSSCSNDGAEIELAAKASGEICYAPVLQSLPMEDNKVSIVLKNVSGEEFTEEFTWTASENYLENCPGPDYVLEVQNGIGYMSIRAFREADFPQTYQDFVNSGYQLKNCNAIIVDIRTNGGGNGSQVTVEWIRALLNKTYTREQIRTERRSILKNIAYGRSESIGFTETTRSSSRTLLKNNIPILVLVDANCGSAGEGYMNALKDIENVIVIGSNSAGAQIGGTPADIYLPNSGISASVGTGLKFSYGLDLVENKGYAPDIWCNPKDALDVAINIIDYYNVCNDEDIKAFKTTGLSNIEEKRLDALWKSEKPDICCNNCVWPISSTVILPADSSSELYIYHVGRFITDCDITIEDQTIGRIVKGENGYFTFVPQKSGTTTITAHSHGMTRTYSIRVE